MEKFYSILAQILEFAINNYSDEIAVAIFAGILMALGWLVNNVKNEVIRLLLTKVVVAVQVTEQTVVSELKKESADGTLSPENRASVRAKSKAVFFEQIGIIGRFVYSLFVGSLDKWFETQKEYVLAEIKKKSSATQ